MSEFQMVAFRAIDGPVSDKDMEYMGKQSSRAEMTPWSFDNEYEYSQFHGDAEEMLRRGYDLHVDYTNYGVRTLLIRLPHGFPNPKAAAPYTGPEFIEFKKDKHGPGGILSISPFIECPDVEYLDDFEELVERLIPLREEVLGGDLRPLYLAHLALACDDNHDPEETTEGPVPAGLNELTDAQQALAEFYGLSDFLISAAGRDSPDVPAQNDSKKLLAEWIKQQPESNRNEWLCQLISDPAAAVRWKIVEQFRGSKAAPAWPTIVLGRTIAALQSVAEDLFRKSKQRKEKTAARQRAKKFADLAADPVPTLKETEQLALERSRESFDKIAVLLADLREAVRGTPHAGIAEVQAHKLRELHPTLGKLVAALRRQGFLTKK